MDDDADLVARVRRGDRQAFDDLYDLYADDVFSMCLLILGDPTVARAAAGTAFALVARTRLNPLSNPAGLRSWLLELARGSALAWSGSPQARSIPVPHGVPPEELLVGAVVPAPASLRVGLARTFDRAATVAEAAATAAANRRAAATAPDAEAVARSAARVSLVKAAAAADTAGAAESAEAPPVRVRAAPLALLRMDADAGSETSPGGDAVAAGAAAAVRGTPDWRSRPAMAAAAAVVVAVAGLTAAMNWPSSDPRLVSEASVAIVNPQPTLPAARPATPPAAPSGRALVAPGLVPTVAGAYTSRDDGPRAVQPRLVEQIAHDVRRLEPTPANAASEPHPASTALPAVPSSPARPSTPFLPASPAPASTAPTVTAPPVITMPPIITPTVPGTGSPGTGITVPPPVHAPPSTSGAPLPTTPALPSSSPPASSPAASSRSSAPQSPPAAGPTANPTSGASTPSPAPTSGKTSANASPVSV